MYLRGLRTLRRTLVVALATAGVAAPAVVRGRGDAPLPALAEANVPEGTNLLRVENLDGVLLLRSKLHGAERDTIGPLVLDTGAGYLAIDTGLARWLGVSDSSDPGDAEVGLAERPLARIEIGDRQIDFVRPLLTIDADIVRRVTDRPVLGLVGQSLYTSDALVVDWRDSLVAFVPSPRPAGGVPADVGARIAGSRARLAGLLGGRAVALPIELAGDGKVLIEARVTDPTAPRWSRPLTLIVDTGASKSVLFADQLRGVARRSGAWPSLRGLAAPTLFGAAAARMARVGRLEVGPDGARVGRDGLDLAVLDGDLGGKLSRVCERPVHGLLGYSFLKHYRTTIDYGARVLWLDPYDTEWDPRPDEYSHPGVQIEREAGRVRIVGVAQGSPADRAGIAIGDELIEADGRPAAADDVVTLARRLEGPPGTSLELVIRRNGRDTRHRLVRRPLL